MSRMQASATQGGWMVSGGVGALGSLMASWLAVCSCNPVRLCLLGRSGRWAADSAAALQPLQTGSALLSLDR